MDILDKAKTLEMADRQRALENHKRMAKEPDQLVVNDQVHCIDCEKPVNPKRLAIKPNAARCISCQSLSDPKERR